MFPDEDGFSDVPASPGWAFLQNRPFSSPGIVFLKGKRARNPKRTPPSIQSCRSLFPSKTSSMALKTHEPTAVPAAPTEAPSFQDQGLFPEA